MGLSLFQRGLIGVLIVGLVVCGVIFVNRLVLGSVFSAEEAQHALAGMWIYRDLGAFDFGAFWYDTTRQMVWPFMHSWLQAAFFLVFGVNYIAARGLSLVFFFISLLLMYLFANRLCHEKGWLVGLIAVALALTSPLMLKYATLNTLESMGALLFIATAYLYLLSEERKVTIEYVFFVILLGLSIYVNYLYAYLLIPAFFVMTLVRLGPMVVGAIKLRQLGETEALHFVWWSYRKLIFMGVFLLFSGAWFSVSFSRKVLLLFTSIFKYSGGTVQPGIWANLAYYPSVIISQLTFSPWLGLLVLVSLFLPGVASRYTGLNRPYAYVWTVLLLLTLTIQTKASQMVYVIIPFVLIIFAGFLVYLFEKIKDNRQMALGFFLVLLLPTLISLPRVFGSYLPDRAGQNYLGVLDYFKETVPQTARVVALFNLDQLHPDGVKFHFKDWQGRVAAAEEFDGQEAGAYFLTVAFDQDGGGELDAFLDHEGSERLKLYSSRRFDDLGLTARIYTSD